MKQIEEMCAIMADASYVACEDIPLVPESTGICDKVVCHHCKEAKRLMNAGYRKQSEVVEEIFAEIEKFTYRYLNDADYSGGDLIYDIAELKKKYTESERNNGKV